jgi:hypothetical protein
MNHVSLLIAGITLCCTTLSAEAYADLLTACGLLHFDPAATGNVMVVHFSDPHMALYAQGCINQQALTTNLDPRLVNAINAMSPPPAKVIVSGDVAYNYSIYPGWMAKSGWDRGYGTNEMLAWLTAVQALTNVPPQDIVWTPGNHDQDWLETNADMFCQVFSNMPPHQAFDLGGIRFLLINGGNYGDPPALEWSWLKQQAQALSPTQTVAVVVHQPPSNEVQGIPVLLRECFGNWSAPVWVLCGHTHYQNVHVMRLGNTTVAEMNVGSANTNQFLGLTANPGFRVFCISNGIVGTIYYHLATGDFQIEKPPDWAHPVPFTAAFESAAGLLWRRLMRNKDPGPELSAFQGGFNCVEYFTFETQLQWTLPLARYANQATHFLLQSIGGLDATITFDFSTDQTNWLRVPLLSSTNGLYSFPLPAGLVDATTAYVRMVNSTTSTAPVAGWGLSTTNGTPAITFPQLAQTPLQQVNVGQSLVVTNTAIDPYAPPDVLNFTLLSAPTNSAIDPNTGVFLWQPSIDDPTGMVRVIIKVADNGLPEMSTTQTFRVLVLASNSPPVIGSNEPPVLVSISNQTVRAKTPLVLTNLATDPDPNAQLAFSLAAGAPANAYIEPASGVLHWTPTATQVGTNALSIVVTDDGNPPLSSTQTFTITVLPPNQPPVLAAISNQVIVPSLTLWLTNTATDSDQDGLSFSLGAGAPTNAVLDPVTGVFTWTPNTGQLGNHQLTVNVTDNGSPPLTTSQDFWITVLEPIHLGFQFKGQQGVISVLGDLGYVYTVLASTNFIDWDILSTTNPPQMPFEVYDPEANLLSQRFYQARRGPLASDWDADALDFFNRASLTDPLLYLHERRALNQLVLDYKASGLWDTKDAIYPFVGGCSNACAQNLRSASYAITFTADGMAYTNGITGDGTGWGDTGLNLQSATHFLRDSASFFGYIGTRDPAYVADLGSFVGAVQFSGATLRSGLERNGSNFSIAGLNSGGAFWNPIGGGGDFRGPVFVSRVDSTVQYHGRRLAMATNFALPSEGLPNATCGLLSRKSESTADHLIACTLLGVSIGAGLTPGDFNVESVLWDRFNATLGRKVP